MADMTASTPEGTQAALAAEDEGYYHECALNAAWSGSRLAIGGLAFLFGAFVFAYFYLRALNSAGRWANTAYRAPSMVLGTIIMLLILVSAGAHYYGLQRIKAGNKSVWQIWGIVALVLGLAAVAAQIVELVDLPFPPGSSGFASLFTGFYPVLVVVLLGGLVWLESLLARSRFIPAMSFVEQPPTYAEVYTVQRFQASLSAFATVWNFLMLITVLFWFLFYVL